MAHIDILPHERESSSASGRSTLSGIEHIDDAAASCMGGADETVVDLTSLTEYEVAQLLAALRLGKYAQACLDVPLRGRDLKQCKDEDLKEIGITYRPHRVSLLEEVERFVRLGVPMSLLESPDAGAPAPVAPAPTGRELSPSPTSTGGDSDAESSAAFSYFSEMPTWLVQAEKHLAELAEAPTLVPRAASPPPMCPIDLISAHLEGLKLNLCSEADTAVRTCRSSAAAR